MCAVGYKDSFKRSTYWQDNESIVSFLELEVLPFDFEFDVSFLISVFHSIKFASFLVVLSVISEFKVSFWKYKVKFFCSLESW